MKEDYPEEFERVFWETFERIAINNKGLTKKAVSKQLWGHERGFWPSSASGKRSRIKLADALRMAQILQMDFFDLCDLVDAKIAHDRSNRNPGINTPALIE